MLMHVTSFELRKRTLNFTSSGQGFVNATALIANDVQLINAIELLDCSDGMVQLIVCEDCGVTNCIPGSWAGIRRIDQAIVLVPAFSAIREGEWESREYAPPKYMLTKGLPTFSASVYDELRIKTGRFPAPNLISECTLMDTLDLLQLTAPGGVFGKPGTQVSVQSEKFLAVTNGDLSEELEALVQLVRSVQEDDRELPSEQPDRLVEFHLNVSGFPTWSPFGYGPGGPVLNLRAIES